MNKEEITGIRSPKAAFCIQILIYDDGIYVTGLVDQPNPMLMETANQLAGFVSNWMVEKAKTAETSEHLS